MAINAIWRLIHEIPESIISLAVYSCKLLVAADFNIKIFFSSTWRRAATASLDNMSFEFSRMLIIHSVTLFTETRILFRI